MTGDAPGDDRVGAPARTVNVSRTGGGAEDREVGDPIAVEVRGYRYVAAAERRDRLAAGARVDDVPVAGEGPESRS